jgi:hypothetical protein
MADQRQILPGTLDRLILEAASLQRMHGYGVLLRIRQISGEALQVPQGSLYPALYRLQHEGLIAAEWGGKREQAEGEVLPVDGGGTTAAAKRDRELEAAGRRDGCGAERDGGGGVRC